MSLLNTDTEIFNKILAKQIQTYGERIRHRYQVSFILGMQSWFNNEISVSVIHRIRNWKKEKPQEHINWCGKVTWQTLMSVSDERSQHTGNKRERPQPDEGHLQKKTHKPKQKQSPQIYNMLRPKQWSKTRMPTLTTLFSITLEDLASAIRQ